MSKKKKKKAAEPREIGTATLVIKPVIDFSKLEVRLPQR